MNKSKNLGDYAKKGATPWNKGIPRTIEERKKMSETRKRLYAERKIDVSGSKNGMYGRKASMETKEKMSKAHKRNPVRYWLGKKKEPLTEEHKLRISNANKGKPKPLELRMRWSESRRGSKTWSWKGGVTPIHYRLRHSLRYKLWREAVFNRDNYTCVWCGDNKGGNLQADHIKPFAYFPELRFELSNGRTLCEPCHRKTDTFGYKENSNLLKLYKS